MQMIFLSLRLLSSLLYSSLPSHSLSLLLRSLPPSFCVFYLHQSAPTDTERHTSSAASEIDKSKGQVEASLEVGGIMAVTLITHIYRAKPKLLLLL